jgi:hypothetical protein
MHFALPTENLVQVEPISSREPLELLATLGKQVISGLKTLQAQVQTHTDKMGLLTILKKLRQKEKEIRVLML